MTEGAIAGQHPSAGGGESPPRRMTADRFRALTARLSGARITPPVLNAAPEPVPAPPPQAAIAPVEPAVAEPPAAFTVEPVGAPAPAEGLPHELESPAVETIAAEAPETVLTEPAATIAVEPVEAQAPADTLLDEDVQPSAEAIAAPDPQPEPGPMPVQDFSYEPEPAIADHSEPAPPPPSVPAPEPEAAPDAPVAEHSADPISDLIGTLQAKFAHGMAIRKPAAAEPDPFARAVEVPAEPPPAQAAPYVIEDSDEQAGEAARSLLDIFSGGAAAQPQERALAADTLLRLIPRIPEKGLVALAGRLSIMEHPPALIAARLIRDPRPSVAGELLERCSALSDKDLLVVIAESGPDKLRLIARRRVLSPALCEALIAKGDESVLLTLTRNSGAAITHEGFKRLSERSKSLPSIQAQLVTRPDTPAPIAFELFWTLQPVLRRLVLSRFLTDSETLDRILKLTLAANEEAETPTNSDPQRIEAFSGQLAWGNGQLAAAVLTELTGISEQTALRIVSDPHGEPLAVIFKVLGVSRAQFADLMVKIQASPSSVLNKNRHTDELQSIFDQLSPNKARVLLTYWDWSSRNTGPYALAA